MDSFNFNTFINHYDLDGLKNKPDHLSPLYPMSGNTPLSEELQAVNAANDENRTLGDTDASLFNDGFDPTVEMNSFLNRKVKIFNATWEHDSTFNHSFSPWTEWANDPIISKKLDNYYLIKGDMKLTFYINGTPFMFGLVLASYRYLSYNTTDNSLTQKSQRPHLWLNVTTCKGGEMEVPFFYPYNYYISTLPQPSTTEFSTVHLDSLVPLRQINAQTSEATISVFAEVTNIRISGATKRPSGLGGVFPGFLSAQSGVIKNAENKELPGISYVKNQPIASLANIDFADSSQRLNVTRHSDINTTVSSVGLGDKDETEVMYLATKESYVLDFPWAPSVTPGTSIFSIDVDPMAELRTTTSEGKGNDTGTRYRQTALGFVSRPFSFWSGTLKYRFQIMASQYHRGRLAFVYDPMGPLDASQPFTSTYHTIVDLADGRDFTIDIPWQQEVPYQRLERTEQYTHWTYGPSAIDRQRDGRRPYTNGILYVIVVNTLSVPDGISQADIGLSISAGPDYETMNPDGAISEFYNMEGTVQTPGFLRATTSEVTLENGIPTTNSTLEVKPKSTSGKKSGTKTSKSIASRVKDKIVGNLEALSAVEKTPEQENSPEAERCENPGENIMISMPMKVDYYFGEKVLSIKDLSQRFTYYRTLHDETNFLSGINRITYLMPMAPQIPGVGEFNPDDIAQPDKKYCYVGQSYITYFGYAYAGWKGSIRWKATPQSPTASCSMVRRTGFYDDPIIDYRPDTTVNYLSTDKPGEYAYKNYVLRNKTAAGAAATQSTTMDSLEFEMPYTRPTRFNMFYEANNVYPPTVGRNVYNTTDGFELMITAPATEVSDVDTYVAAGKDFNFYGFVGAPSVYTHLFIPTPVN